MLVAYRLTRETAWTSTTSRTLTDAPSTMAFDPKGKAHGIREEVTVTVEETKSSGSEKLASQTTLKV